MMITMVMIKEKMTEMMGLKMNKDKGNKQDNHDDDGDTSSHNGDSDGGDDTNNHRDNNRDDDGNIDFTTKTQQQPKK